MNCIRKDIEEEQRQAPVPGIGRLYSVDWTRDWTVGQDCGTGLTESCTNRFE